MGANRKRITDFASKSRLLFLMYGTGQFVDAGGLTSLQR